MIDVLDTQPSGQEYIFINALQDLESKNKLMAQNIREFKPTNGEIIGARKLNDQDDQDSSFHEIVEDSVEDDLGAVGGELFDFDDDS